MSILANLHHVTRYRYDRPVALGPQVVRLRPAPHCRTRVLSYSLKVTPAQHFVNWQQDPHGNWLARFVFPENTDEFSITVDLLADMAVVNPFDFFVEPYAESFPFVYPTEFSDELAPFLDAEPAGPRLAAFLASVSRDRRNIVDFLVELNQRLQREIRYLIRMEPGVQTPEETLAAGSGSCRDTAWLLVQILRHLGLAARFVSGYLIQLQARPEGARRPGRRDAGFHRPACLGRSLHSGRRLDRARSHLGPAVRRGPSPARGDAALPLGRADQRRRRAGRGEVRVRDERHARRREAARHLSVLRRGLDGARRARRQGRRRSGDAGRAPDHGRRADLRVDRRLPVGGMEHGCGRPDQARARRRADPPAARPFRARRAPALRPGQMVSGRAAAALGVRALLAHGRQADLAQRRADRDRDAGGRTPAVGRRRAPRSPSAARRRGSASPRDFVQPAFEDPAERMLKEGELPANIDPSDPKIDDPDERARIMRAFERGSARPPAMCCRCSAGTRKPRPAGSANSGSCGAAGCSWCRAIPRSASGCRSARCPISCRPTTRIWCRPIRSTSTASCRMPRRWPRFSLIGLRMPPRRRSCQALARRKVRPPPWPRRRAPPAFRCAPPWRSSRATAGSACSCRRSRQLEDYLELLAAVEATAARARACRCMSRAMRRRADPRLNVIKVTPDPGVIEVNVHPAASWREAVDITRTLYEDARLSRLGTDKFMIDGRHTGTGGGNHVVLGGLNAADSPFLRRPDLLKSLILYWQRHPSLSYLFSGLFIGPTSQAPRIDEARHDQLYELEIALALVPAPGEGEPPRPWLVDRLFRNLLVDVTGNTHRAEICIDKLFSPDGADRPARPGRIPLVRDAAGRAHEPGAAVAAARADRLVLARAAARRAGALGHGAARPLHAGAFRLGGFPRRARRSARAPATISIRCGSMRSASSASRSTARSSMAACSLELRQALEPWHVLGEDDAAGGTVRFVDSSVERLQVKVEGFNAERHVVTCNGRRAAADVDRPARRIRRRRALQGLEAAVGAASDHRRPRAADLRHLSIAGTGARSAAASITSPIRAAATTRPSRSIPTRRRRGGWRASRITATRPGSFDIPREERSLEYPMTLDLRRPTQV